MYRIVFWQNCLSPHQMPYIIHLLDDKRVNEVIVITDVVTTEDRKKMGWDLDNNIYKDKCKIIISPNENNIHSIFSERENESFHFFSGINAYPFVKKALDISLRYNISRGLITERPYTFKFGKSYGKPLWLHRIRFFLKDRKYAKHIKIVFAMGDDAVKYFKSVYSGWKVYPFIYCTNNKIN